MNVVRPTDSGHSTDLLAGTSTACGLTTLPRRVLAQRRRGARERARKANNIRETVSTVLPYSRVFILIFHVVSPVKHTFHSHHLIHARQLTPQPRTQSRCFPSCPWTAWVASARETSERCRQPSNPSNTVTAIASSIKPAGGSILPSHGPRPFQKSTRTAQTSFT